MVSYSGRQDGDIRFRCKKKKVLYDLGAEIKVLSEVGAEKGVMLCDLAAKKVLCDVGAEKRC